MRVQNVERGELYNLCFQFLFIYLLGTWKIVWLAVWDGCANITHFKHGIFY